MSRGKGIEAGKAFILLTIKNRTKKDLLQAQRDLQKFALKLGVLGGALVLGGRQFSGLFLRAAKEFSTFEQLIGRFQSVFLDLSGEATKFADTLAAGISQSVLIIKDQLAQTQALFQGFGFEGEVSLPLTQALVSGAQDLLAFDDNLQSAQQGLDKLLGGLTGSNVRGVRSFGADVTEAAVALELLALGINKTAVEASQQEKNIARLSILLRALGRAGVTGQAAREINTLASRFRALQGALKEALAAIGAGFGNQLATILNGFKGLLKSIQTFATENPRVFQALALVGPIMIGLGAAALTAAAGIFVFSGAIGAIAAPIAALSGLIVPAVAIGVITTAVIKLSGSTDDLKGALLSMGNSVGQALKPLIAGFDGINEALKLGNVAAAAEIGLLTLEIAMDKTFGNIIELWKEVEDTIKQGLARLFIDHTLEEQLFNFGPGGRLKELFDANLGATPEVQELIDDAFTKAFGGGGSDTPSQEQVFVEEAADRKADRAQRQADRVNEIAGLREISDLQEEGRRVEALRATAAQKARREAAAGAEEKRTAEVEAFKAEQDRLEEEEKQAKTFKPFSEGTFSGVAAKQAFGPSVSIAKASLKKQEEQVDLTKVIIDVLKANDLPVFGAG